MQCCGALRRPLRNIIKSIGYVHATPDNALCADERTNRILCGHPSTHDRLLHTNDGAVARLRHAGTWSGRGRWLRSGGIVTDGRPRGVLRYSTAAAASETREDNTSTRERRPDAHRSHEQGLRITRATLSPKDNPGTVRYLVLGEKHDNALELPSQRSLEDRLPDDEESTSRGHGPVRRVFAKTPDWELDENGNTHSAQAQGGNQSSSESDPSSYFNSMIEEVTEHGPDYTKYRSSYRRRYFLYQQKEQRVRNAAHERRLQLQAERHAAFAKDDWHTALKLLDAHTPAGPELYKQKVDKLTLPEGFLAVFHHDVSLAVLEIRQRTGSHVQLVDGGVQRVKIDGNIKNAYATLTLSGSIHENEAALAILSEYMYVYSAKELNASQDLNDYDLQRRQQNLPRKDDYEASDKGQHTDNDDELSLSDLRFLNETVQSITSPVRSVWSMDRWGSDTSRYRLGMQPTIRTRVSMTQYIIDITISPPRMIVRKEDHGEGKAAAARVVRVVKELVSLCTDPDAPSWLTSEALDKALQYLLSHSNLRAFRTIRRALEDCGKYQFTSSNYAVLLDGAARVGDLENFTIILRLMLKREVPFTADVWMHFQKLAAVRKIPGALNTLEHLMHQKGLLADHKVARALSEDTVIERLNAALVAGTPFEVFLERCNAQMSRAYPRGFDWFDAPVARRMAHLLLQWGHPDDAYKVVDRLRERNKPVPISILNFFLSSALSNRDPAAACSILQRFLVGQPGAVVPDRITYQELFTLAWTQKYFNMVRVIWRYACAAGHVNYSMRSRFRHSLCQATGQEERKVSQGRQWALWAGKFAVGVSRGLGSVARLEGAVTRSKSKYSAVDDILLESEHRLLELASRPALEKTSEPERERYDSLLGMMQDDLGQAGDSKPTEPLSKLLARAHATDIAWKESGLPRGWSDEGQPNAILLEMLKNGIRVPMKAGDFSRGTREWEVPGAHALWA